MQDKLPCCGFIIKSLALQLRPLQSNLNLCHLHGFRIYDFNKPDYNSALLEANIYYRQDPFRREINVIIMVWRIAYANKPRGWKTWVNLSNVRGCIEVKSQRNLTSKAESDRITFCQRYFFFHHVTFDWRTFSGPMESKQARAILLFVLLTFLCKLALKCII